MDLLVQFEHKNTSRFGVLVCQNTTKIFSNMILNFLWSYIEDYIGMVHYGTFYQIKVVYNNRSTHRMFAAMKRQRTRRDGGASSGRACKLSLLSILDIREL